MTDGDEERSGALRRKAMRVILTFGVISLFGDIIYEGARSVNGAYLSMVGMDAALVGIVTGLAQFTGASLRYVMGYTADRKKAYWAFTIAGYGMIASVPMMALTGTWQVLALLIVLEALAKALRAPSKEVILSQATKQVGTGWGFAVHEAMDQLGASIGPLVFIVLFALLGTTVVTLRDYQMGYSLLWIPFQAMMILVVVAYLTRTAPGKFEPAPAIPPAREKLTGTFWLYSAFVLLSTIGFLNFTLAIFHMKTKSLLPDVWIPATYCVAMAFDGLMALVAGKLYDWRKKSSGWAGGGVSVLAIVPLLAMPLPLMLFSDSLYLILPAVLMWGAVMGIHESILRAGVADLTSLNKRGAGYGVFYTLYGLGLFGASVLAGALYAVSIMALTAITVVVELASLVPLYFLVSHREPAAPAASPAPRPLPARTAAPRRKGRARPGPAGWDAAREPPARAAPAAREAPAGPPGEGAPGLSEMELRAERAAREAYEREIRSGQAAAATRRDRDPLTRKKELQHLIVSVLEEKPQKAMLYHDLVQHITGDSANWGVDLRGLSIEDEITYLQHLGYVKVAPVRHEGHVFGLESSILTLTLEGRRFYFSADVMARRL